MPAVGDTAELELAGALKHDLGKYVAWRSANLPDDAWSGKPGDALTQALRADILQTHGEEAAWSVWDRLTADLPRPLDVPELHAVEEAVALLRAAESALRSSDPAGLEALLPGIRSAQARIRTELRDYHRRLLRREG